MNGAKIAASTKSASTTNPTTAALLRTNRSKMIRPWLRRLRVSSRVSSIAGELGLDCMIAMAGLPSADLGLGAGQCRTRRNTTGQGGTRRNTTRSGVANARVYDAVQDIGDQV